MRITGKDVAKAKRDAGGAQGPCGLAYQDANMQEKRDIVARADFEMDWDALQKDLDLLGDWPDTRKPRDSAEPTRKVPPKERGSRVLMALAKQMGRETESTRGLRSWLLEHRPASS